MIKLIQKVCDYKLNLRLFTYSLVTYNNIYKFLKDSDKNILLNILKSYSPYL